METIGSGAEKREHPRHPVKIPVTFRRMDDNAQPRSLKDLPQQIKSAQTLDSSVGGMFVVCEEPLQKGDLVSLKLGLPTGGPPFTAFAEVAWMGPSGAGLKFLAVKEQDVQRLEDFLKTVAPQA